MVQSVLYFALRTGLHVLIELRTCELILYWHSRIVARPLQENQKHLWWLICHRNITQTVNLARRVNGEVQFISVEDFILLHKSEDFGLLLLIPTNEEPCWDVLQSRVRFCSDSITSLKYGLSTVELSLFSIPGSVLKSSTPNDILPTISSCQMQSGQSLKILELSL